MIGTLPTGLVSTAEISAVSHRGLSVTLADGRPGKLAIVDDAGAIIDASPAVAREAWNVSINAYKQVLKGMGHLRVLSGPIPGIGEVERPDHRPNQSTARP